MTLTAERLSLTYGERTVVKSLNLTIPNGKVTVLIGRNGSGKSTILKALGRLLKPSSGHVVLDGKAIDQMESRALARQLAILPQGPIAPEGLTVEELVKQGRFPHQNWLGIASKEDREAVERALAAMQLTELRERPLQALSGGQRQRAWIAMSLAQETPILLLDEPTTYLDVAHQLEVLELVAELNRRDGRTVVMVLHDLNQAARYADHLVAISFGQVVAEGAPKELLTPELIRRVFGVDAHVLPDPETGCPICVPRYLVGTV
jgi:iron complex transport system ATP-binding protein